MGFFYVYMDNPQRRGRKPKGKIIQYTPVVVNTETPIIAHLPIEYNENENEDDDNDIFIKTETPKKKLSISNKDKKIKELSSKIEILTEKLKSYETSSVPQVFKVEDIKNAKCWWCRYDFTTPKVELVEHYFNNKFHCIGCFCSYNCALSYNINLNDENVSKKTALLHFHYKNTYNKHIIIRPAPSWKILKDAGGPTNIKEYRENFITNRDNYLYIKPPMVSRIAHIEKTPRVVSNIPKKNELVLKRSKPLNSSKYTLETTMGLKKIMNHNDTN